jgi:hypothetical protein
MGVKSILNTHTQSCEISYSRGIYYTFVPVLIVLKDIFTVVTLIFSVFLKP